MSKLVLMVGYPASGKSTYVAEHFAGATVLSRDQNGGSTAQLMPALERALSLSSPIIVLDNTHLTKAIRAPFIAAARRHGVPVDAVFVSSTLEDCQIRAIRRQFATHGEVYFTGKQPTTVGALADPHVFPLTALFHARKIFEAPTMDEGFREIQVFPCKAPVWDALNYPEANKAVFLDIDGTLRKTDHLPLHYPTHPDEVELVTDPAALRARLEQWRASGHRLIGVSNQSGIHKGCVTEEAVQACFARTRELLGYTEAEFPITYCPHRPAPIACYCRKPQTGLVVKALETHRMAPKNCIFVGDRTTDATTAQRLGMPYLNAKGVDWWI